MVGEFLILVYIVSQDEGKHSTDIYVCLHTSQYPILKFLLFLHLWSGCMVAAIADAICPILFYFLPNV